MSRILRAACGFVRGGGSRRMLETLGLRDGAGVGLGCAGSLFTSRNDVVESSAAPECAEDS